jgi:hypothetical protein
MYNKLYLGYKPCQLVKGEKTNVLRTISADQYPENEDRDGP